MSKNDPRYSNKSIGAKKEKYKCPFCRHTFHHVPRHLLVCKRKRRQELAAQEARAVPQAANDEDPSAEGPSNEVGTSELPDYEKGGQFVLLNFEKWLVKRDFRPTTRLVYVNKMREIILHFEDKDENFIADNLLFCIEKDMNVPSIVDYFYEQESANVQDTIYKSYTRFLLFLLSRHTDKYLNDRRVPRDIKRESRDHLENMTKEAENLIKGLNKKKARMLAKKVDKQRKDPAA